VSKHDSHFFNLFSVVLGILIAIAIGLFVMSRIVGHAEQAELIKFDPQYQAEAATRLAPFGRVAVAGQDNAAFAIKVETASAAPAPALALPENGEATYKAVCSTCHSAGIAGAPKSGDKAAWAPRIAQGKTTLYKHALEGFQGKNGVMPAKGGRADLPDDLIRQTVDYMVSINQ
jgi:cytochrome c5